MTIDFSSVDFVIYHANCSDGFGAAYSAWKLLGDRAEYHAAKHGEPPPNVAGKNVVVLDFSYDNSTTKRLMNEAKSFFIIDHHKSAMIELHDIDCAHFDMNHSGAFLAWKFFHPDKEIPRMIKLIEDRDLWKWEIPYSKEFSAAFDMVELSFEEFDKYLKDSEIDSAQKRGAYIVNYTKSSISKILKNASSRKILGKNVLVINSPFWISEIGETLSQKCNFSVVWYYDHMTESINVSLRTQNENCDVSEVAKSFGGGGHKKAAGFRLPPNTNIENIFDK